MIQSSHSKIPRNFREFLKNGENKTRLIEIVKDELVAKKTTVLQELKCRRINFSMDGICYGITKDSVEVIDELSSNQEEADTKLLLHAKHAKEMDQNRSVLVRSPSGDVDINVLFTSMFKEDNTDIYIDYGSGKFRKILQLNSIDMSDEHKSALIGFHAFTGNDYVSSIFRKSKKFCWKLLEKNFRFVRAFIELGSAWDIDDALLSLLEEYVCNLFGKKQKDINKVRYTIFKNVYEKKGKIQDLSFLPPCRQSLLLHCRRSNYIAIVWRSCFDAEIDFDNISNHGWSNDAEIVWMDTAFPEQIETILADENEDSEDELDFPAVDADESSDSDED